MGQMTGVGVGVPVLDDDDDDDKDDESVFPVELLDDEFDGTRVHRKGQGPSYPLSQLQLP
jgi:hypothetical protein